MLRRGSVGRDGHMMEPVVAALAALLIAALTHAEAGSPGQLHVVTAADAAASATSKPPVALVDDGRRRYTGMCVRCHGLNLVTNGIGFDLRTFPRDGKERFGLSVRRGLRAMPSFESIITEADIDALWAYIGSVNGWSQ